MEGDEERKCNFKKFMVDFKRDEKRIGSWLEKLQVRRRDERLKVQAEDARPLMQKNEEIGGEILPGDERSSKKSRYMRWLERNKMALR
jgi:hypothetical protein